MSEFNNFVTNVCQYFPPKNLDKRKVKTSKSNAIDIEFESIRKKLILKTFAKLDSQINKVRNELFSPLMQSLFQFVSENSMNNDLREKSFETKFSPNTGLIPTALLSIGMNSSEHKFICDLLMESIQDLTTFVVYLNSSQTQTMSSVFRQICDTILTEEVIESASLDKSQIKAITFEFVLNIYEQIVINNNTNDFCSPIVFFLDGIENFDHSLITSLILIIKEYLKRIPFILIMVKSNETISLQHLLPSNATDFLVIHPFQSFCGHKIVDKIIEEFLIESSLPFKLGPNVLEFMIKMFENFDFSIQNIQNYVKYCVFQHFYANELSFLCQSESKFKSFVKNNDIKGMKAFRHSKLFDLSLNQKEFSKSLINRISEFVSIHKSFVNNLKVLQKLLNSNNCELSLTQLYVNFLDKSYDSKQIIDSLNRLSQNQWKSSLEICAHSSSDDSPLHLTDILKACQQTLIEATQEQNSGPQVLIERLDMSDIKNKLSNLKTRHQWKEMISPLNKPKVLTKFELWKKTTIESIGKAITEMPHPMSSAFSEIAFFEDLESLQKNIFVVLRDDIHKSLSNPLFIGDKTQKQTITNFHKFFDIHIESPTIFNMFDAFKDFTQSLDSFDKNGKRIKTDDTNNENIVGFITSVSDFEYMGVIQSAKYKTDHLMRLIWF